ncbi:MAG: flagellar protein FlgN [Syntrophales bacterium]|nr:flagellar protein FlgN [Syntrophales bacterium]
MIPEDAFAALKNIVSIETDAWDRLETCLQDEKQALRRQDLSAITSNTIQKEMAINGVRLAADNRRKFLSNMGPRLGLKPPFAMENLFDMAGHEQRQEMSAWQAKFAAYAASIDKLNKENTQTIKISLAVVSDSLRFLNNIIGLTPTYTAGGNITAHTLQGRILSKRG